VSLAVVPWAPLSARLRCSGLLCAHEVRCAALEVVEDCLCAGCDFAKCCGPCGPCEPLGPAESLLVTGASFARPGSSGCQGVCCRGSPRRPPLVWRRLVGHCAAW
jgi:hypothetical protein